VPPASPSRLHRASAPWGGPSAIATHSLSRSVR
jgi:hypothetical protein